MNGIGSATDTNSRQMGRFRLRRMSTDQTNSLAHGVAAISAQVGQDLHFSTRPEHFGFLYLLLFTQTEVEAEVVLRKIASAAEHFRDLDDASGSHTDARIQGKSVALRAFQLEADPVMVRASFGAQNDRAADQ